MCLLTRLGPEASTATSFFYQPLLCRLNNLEAEVYMMYVCAAVVSEPPDEKVKANTVTQPVASCVNLARQAAVLQHSYLQSYCTSNHS